MLGFPLIICQLPYIVNDPHVQRESVDVIQG